jgi:hypothetical protein
MFRLFSHSYSEQNSAAATSSDSNKNAEACLHIFAPGPLVKLYCSLQKYIEKNGKKPPTSSYLPDAVTTSLISWTGTGATNQTYASDALAVIEKYLKEDLPDLLLATQSKLYDASRFKPALLKDVYLAVRELPQILASMPSESITLFYIKPGSDVRRDLTAAISFYEQSLKNQEFPVDLDIHSDNHRLSQILKNY